MKKIFSNLVAFLLMGLLIIIIIFNVFEISIKKTNNYLNKSNYLDMVYENIEDKISEYVYNDELLDDYISFFNKKLIKEDINNLINNKEINHNNSLNMIINKYTDNQDIINTYTSNIQNIYINNIFPTKEYKIISNYVYTLEDIILINFIIISIIIVIFTILYFLNNNFYYHIVSVNAISYLLIILSIIIKILFNKFNYINEYYTSYFKYIINFNAYTYLGTAIFIIVITVLLIKRVNKTCKKI